MAARTGLFTLDLIGEMMTFAPFDPLSFKNTTINEAALGSLKREIQNILSSYVGWYDPFCELIQNGLDAVEARADYEKSAGTLVAYGPRLDIRIDLDDNSLTVTDNGIGLDKDRFQQFLAPNFSFKTGNTRGHKGVGATYVAYGFNYIRVSTKVPGFEASGRILNARKWLAEASHSDNPKVEPDESAQTDSAFDEVDRGVSVTVRFDDSTHPKKLAWVGANNAEVWSKILDIKTGLGSFQRDSTIRINVRVVKDGATSSLSHIGTAYFWLHESAKKNATYRELAKAAEELHEKYGAGYKFPDKYNNLDFIYDTWTSVELTSLFSLSLDEEEKGVIAKHSPTVSVEFGCTAKLWTGFNDSLGLRPNYKVLVPGIQLAANNMPQGDAIQVPLVRYTGRQQQVHFLFHFENYTPDLGRKGFHRELSDFAKSVSRSLMENQLSKFRSRLKANTGVAPDFVRELEIADWKKDMLKHESAQPLVLASVHFFKPTEKLSITSKPTREQDVIALFHQLIAGGVIRGLHMMSTNERFTYDGLFKISFDLKSELYEHSAESNPLGVPSETAKALQGRVTDPRILEYKYSLDGLIADFDEQNKNAKDIDLCVAWETGEQYKDRYGITSLLIPENADQRQFHGITHVLTDLDAGAKVCNLIILSELIEFLNDPIAVAEAQRKKYE